MYQLCKILKGVVSNHINTEVDIDTSTVLTEKSNRLMNGTNEVGRNLNYFLTLIAIYLNTR